MSPSRNVAELIQRYLDRVATAAEVAELEARLHEPDVRTAFVAASRLHAWLEEALTEEAHGQAATTRVQTIAAGRRRGMPARWAWKRWAAVAALLLVVLGPWRQTQEPPRPPDARQQAYEPIPAPQLAVDDRVAPPPVVEAVAFFGLATAKAVR